MTAAVKERTAIRESRQLHASFRLTAALTKLPVRTLKNDGEYIRRDSVMDLIGAWLGEISAKEGK